MSETTGLLTEEVRSWIGREVVYEAPEELGRSAIRYFAMALGDNNSLYFDDEYARDKGYPSVIAPPTLICETNQLVPGSRDGRAYVGHAWELPIQGARPLRGGNSYTFMRPVLPADRITSRWRLTDITERVSSRGEPMLIVTSEVTYTDAQGEVVATNVETLIYRTEAR